MADQGLFFPVERPTNGRCWRLCCIEPLSAGNIFHALVRRPSSFSCSCCFFFFPAVIFSSGSPQGTLVVAGLIAGLAFVTRYAGITLIGTGGLLLLSAIRSSASVRKIRQILIFGGSAFVFPAINLYHNLLAGGALIGNREKGIASFGSNMHDLGSVFCDWLHIPNDYYLLAYLIGLGWILLFLAVFILRLARKKTGCLPTKIFAIAFFIVYAVFILASATVSRFQPLDSRLLSPLFIPWIWGSASHDRGMDEHPEDPAYEKPSSCLSSWPWPYSWRGNCWPIARPGRMVKDSVGYRAIPTTTGADRKPWRWRVEISSCNRTRTIFQRL